MNQPSEKGITLAPKPLTAEAYRIFGDVLEADAGRTAKKANKGAAELYDRLAEVQNLRPDVAKQNWKIYRCTPCMDRPVRVVDLEKHAHSTQLFVPMGNAGRYLIVVAVGDATPDLQTLAAFVATREQAMTYHPGVWHLPMTVLDCESDMLSLVYEDGSDGDCAMAKLPIEITVAVS